MPGSQAIRQSLALALLVTTAACAVTSGWQTQRVVPQETKRTLYAGDVRVITADGTTHALRGVWVSADSLGGWLVEPAGVERAFALTEISAVQVRDTGNRQQAGGTLGAKKWAALVMGAFVVFISGCVVYCLASDDCMM